VHDYVIYIYKCKADELFLLTGGKDQVRVSNADQFQDTSIEWESIHVPVELRPLSAKNVHKALIIKAQTIALTIVPAEDKEGLIAYIPSAGDGVPYNHHNHKRLWNTSRTTQIHCAARGCDVSVTADSDG
jgi:hypothetical protein